MKPPMNDPTMPRRIVAGIDMGSGPGTSARARKPATMPMRRRKKMKPIMELPFERLTWSPGYHGGREFKQAVVRSSALIGCHRADDDRRPGADVDVVADRDRHGRALAERRRRLVEGGAVRRSDIDQFPATVDMAHQLTVPLRCRRIGKVAREVDVDAGRRCIGSAVGATAAD